MGRGGDVDEVEDPVQLVVGAHGGVVEEHQLADAGLGGDDDRLLDRGVPVEVGEGSLGFGELGVVEEHVDALHEVPHLRGDALRRGVVGEVRERPRVARHPVAQRATALVVDLDRGHLELLDGRGARRIGQEPPGAEQPLRLDGERRRREHPGQQVPGRGAVLRRDVQVDPGVVVVHRPAERQALHVVPVQVAEQDRPPERLRAHQRGEGTDPGAGVHQQGGCRRAVGQDGHARRVTAVPDVVRAGGRRRAPDAQQHEFHGPDSRPVRQQV